VVKIQLCLSFNSGSYSFLKLKKGSNPTALSVQLKDEHQDFT